MTETNYVIINSKFRSLGSKSTSDFLYELGETIEVTQVAIKSVSIVNAEYNIKPSNNTFIVSNGITDTTFTIPVGQYNINELITVVENLLTATYGGTNTITLTATTFKLLFSTTTPLKYKITRDSPLSRILGLGDLIKPTNGLVYFPLAVSSSVAAPDLPNLVGANNFHILSQTLGQGVGSLLENNDKRPIILTVPVTADFGGVINYEVNEMNLNKRDFGRPINIQNIDIKVIDDDNEIVDLGGTDVEIVLQVIKTAVLPYSTQGNERMF
tara:strand:+ start:1219 stop:2028 length:810 start_codon:yes stop_codon:yes gene_type:complete